MRSKLELATHSLATENRTMHTDSMTEVQSRILAVVGAILAQNSMPGGVSPGARLADVGLTSMDMVNLMLGVEAAFDMTIPQADITPENFQSIESIERLVLARQQLAAA
jgi:acyl carrier protein